ncbi:pyridoxal-phosphate dependent enzyme, partial [Streptomyces sp. SID5475]|nr:pyridoxal-phosphate dependent enzyme [Streptomyces sp. SID5475]
SRQARALDSADPDPLAGELAARLLDERVTVADEDIRRAVGVYAREYRQTAEPSGALALAAVLSGRVRPAPGPVGVVLSGGNVTADAGGRPALTTGRETPRAPGRWAEAAAQAQAAE